MEIKVTKPLPKHSVLLFGHATSITLEPEFWQELKAIAIRKNTSLNKLIEQIDATRKTNLSSALRVFVLQENFALPHSTR